MTNCDGSNPTSDPGRIAADPAPICFLCGTTGSLLYRQLQDRCYAAPGGWNQLRCPNPECGLIWLDPMPTREDIGKAYQTYYTHKQPASGRQWIRDAVHGVWRCYLGVRLGYRTGVGPRWAAVFAPLALLHPGGPDELDSAAMYLRAPKSPGRVLDVGCGSGVLLAGMKSLGWQVEGVEIDPGGVAATRAHGVTVHQGELTEQEFPANHFDAIHSSHVIEHVHDPLALLRECFRILKPGGKLVVITPNTASLGHRHYGAAWLNLDPPRHLMLFNRTNLGRVAVAQGFEIERLDSTVRSAWVYAALSRRILRTGRGEMATIGKPLDVMLGVIFQLRERVACWFNPDAGDEFVMIATKR